MVCYIPVLIYRHHNTPHIMGVFTSEDKAVECLIDCLLANEQFIPNDELMHDELMQLCDLVSLIAFCRAHDYAYEYEWKIYIKTVNMNQNSEMYWIDELKCDD